MEIHNKVEKVYMKNTDVGNLGLPEIKPVKVMTGEFGALILTFLFQTMKIQLMHSALIPLTKKSLLPPPMIGRSSSLMLRS